MTAIKPKEPVVNYSSKAAIGFKNALIDPENQTWLLTIAGAPTNGAAGTGDGGGWAGKGSLLIDVTNGYLYINTGSSASTVWTKVGTQT